MTGPSGSGEAGGLGRVAGFRGTRISTYLDPRGVPGGGQRGGALSHQIWEIGVAEERTSVARETVAGSRAPPPSPMPLEVERKGAGLMCSEALIDSSGLVTVLLNLFIISPHVEVKGSIKFIYINL